MDVQYLIGQKFVPNCNPNYLERLLCKYQSYWDCCSSNPTTHQESHSLRQNHLANPKTPTINENIYSYYSKRHMFEALCLDNSHENQRRATTLPRVCDIVTQVPKPYWQARGKRLPPTGKPVPFPVPPNWYWSFT